MSPQRTTIDGLDVITVTRPQTARTVVMLHGFGANYDDLAPLAPYLDPKGEWNWIFPNGIQTVEIGPHMTGRAWFPIRMAEIEAAAMRGETVDFADTLPDGMAEAQRRLVSLIELLRLDSRQLVLGGFSQGAMMAVDVAAHLPAPIAGLVIFSGTLINRKAWAEALLSKAAVPYFQSHGRNDPILAYAHAERLHQSLGAAGLKGEFAGFQGGHEIPLPVIQRAAAFLQKLRP